MGKNINMANKNSKYKISICIPTWEQHGFGTQYLDQLLSTIANQTLAKFEVVVSDHSENTDIQKLVETYRNLGSNFDIVYVKNIEARGNGPANTNNSIKYASGKIVKIMFQDDFFVDRFALEKIYDQFKYGCNWLVNGCNHTNDGVTFFRDMQPRWNENILVGNNTISSPSVLAFINQDVLKFDESLVMLMDCEYYYKLYKKYGEPYILRDVLISNRIHKNQIQATYSGSLGNEINYVRKIHGV
jgi:glycosyltransferase involved in cell wall biosynthesis